MKKIMKFLDVIYYNFYLYYNNQKVHYIDPEMMPCVAVSNTFVNTTIIQFAKVVIIIEVYKTKRLPFVTVAYMLPRWSFKT